MVLKDGRVKLLDVEAQPVVRDLAQPWTAVHQRRAAGGVTSRPEQINRVPVTEKTDIYAFGVILYEMLAGGAAVSVRRRAAGAPREAPDGDGRSCCAAAGAPSPPSVEPWSWMQGARAKRPERRPLMPDLLDPPLGGGARAPRRGGSGRPRSSPGAGFGKRRFVVLVAWSLFRAALVGPAPGCTAGRTGARAYPNRCRPRSRPTHARAGPPPPAPPQGRAARGRPTPAASKLPQPGARLRSRRSCDPTARRNLRRPRWRRPRRRRSSRSRAPPQVAPLVRPHARANLRRPRSRRPRRRSSRSRRRLRSCRSWRPTLAATCAVSGGATRRRRSSRSRRPAAASPPPPTRANPRLPPPNGPERR